MLPHWAELSRNENAAPKLSRIARPHGVTLLTLGARATEPEGQYMNDDDPILLREAELRQAQLTSDVELLDRLLDDALVFTTLEGLVVGKADDLNLHRSGRLHITKMDPSDRRVVRLGSTVVVSVRMDAEATFDGQAMRGALRYTRVWCERPDGWRVVAGHMSSVPS